MAFSFSDCPKLSDYIQRYQVDGLVWKAEQLLAGVDSPLLKDDRCRELARTIALIPDENQVMKDEYVQRIAKTHGIQRKTLEKLVSDQVSTGRKKTGSNTPRKNKVISLNGNPATFPFFVETKDQEGNFKGVKIDKVRFVQLLGSFGFTRYADESDIKHGYTFVRLINNVIREVSAEEIKDFIEEFVSKEYDFDGAGYDNADVHVLMNHFYDNMTRLFSKDLFARVRNPNPIIMSRDTSNECFLYFQNGFVRINRDDYELMPYDKLDGSVWENQMLSRTFEKRVAQWEVTSDQFDPARTFTDARPLGVFADFVWRLSGERAQRFWALCTIIGYLVHDYYDTKLKAILLTDSTISDASEGRTGKTLMMQLLGLCRSYCEINGKTFRSDDERKYQTADRSTQILHINDLSHSGKNKFDFESLFNDITEGYYVKALYKSPFRQRSKIALSSNRTVRIEGSSARDRVVEFEVSNFFGEHRSPLNYYGHWLGKWDEKEFVLFDNFICMAVQVYLIHGLQSPDSINLEARKLRDQTSVEFLDFMTDIAEEIKRTGVPWHGYESTAMESVSRFEDFKLEKNQLFRQFIMRYSDFKMLTQRRFNNWLMLYARYHLRIEPIESKSNGRYFIQFKSATSK